MKAVLIGLITLIVSGCGLPVPLSYLNYGRMTYDVKQIIQDGTTVADTALGLMTGMDCKVSNVFRDKYVCARKVIKDEYNHLDVNYNSDSVCTVFQ